MQAPAKDSKQLFLQYAALEETFGLGCNLLLNVLQTLNNEPYLDPYLYLYLQAPAKDSKQLFLQYAALEETYGLARSAMEVYDRAVRTIIDKERLEVYNLYLARATQFFGVGKVCYGSEPLCVHFVNASQVHHGFRALTCVQLGNSNLILWC